MSKSIISALLLTFFFILALPVGVIADDSKATIGGYGELHFSMSKSGNNKTVKRIEFHRFYLFLDYQFSKKWSVKTEVGVDQRSDFYTSHDDKHLNLVKAVIDYRGSQYFGFQVGVVQPSMGLLNDKHEPQMFLSVERPNYSENILFGPRYNNGAAIYGNAGGFDYKLTVMEGLKTYHRSYSYGNEVTQLPYFDSLFYNLRVDYTAIPGLLAGASVSFTKQKMVNMEIKDLSYTIAEIHAKYEANNVYAVFELGSTKISDNNYRKAFGYYFDLGYNIGHLFHTKAVIYPWIHYANCNPSDQKIREDYRFTEKTIGLTVKPIPNIVFKMEYGKNLSNYFSMGAGYTF